MPVRPLSEVAVGDVIGPVTVPVARETLVAYANASLDQNPIHQDEEFARSVGLPDVIAHGMWTMGASGTVVADWAGDAGRVVEFGTRFTRPVEVPVDGNAALIKAFLLYRTYHGSAMGPHVQLASIAAWNDEAHVIENRRLYAQKFSEVTPIISAHLPCAQPDAGFYLWANTRATGLSDAEFVLGLHRQQNVLVLPGSYLARDADGCNPGDNFVRIALVATPEECLDAARRIESFCLSL